MTASECVPQETKRILGSELVAAITRNPDYVAIERIDEFLSQVSHEQGRYNNIDDKKLFELGQKYGASNVCVAEITKFGDEYYIVSRLLDIRTQRVWKTARKSSELKSLGELMSVSEAVADELIGNTKELSTYAYGDNSSNQSFITKIENRENYTKVTFKYLSLSDTQVIGIGVDSYIEDIVTGRHYKLKNASNINIVKIYSDMKDYKHIGKGIWEYSLFFERIPERTRSIKIIDKQSYITGWIYNDIVLKPYGKPDYYVFKDDTDSEYKKLQDSYVYYINFENRHSDPRNIYINGKFIGQVKGYGYKKLTISVDDYGHLESIQASGYLISPNKESWNVPKQIKGTTINLKN